MWSQINTVRRGFFNVYVFNVIRLLQELFIGDDIKCIKNK